MKNTTIELTRDMAECLVEHFDRFQSDQKIQVISNNMGLWFVVPGSRNPKFIGKARIGDAPNITHHIQH